MFIYYLLAIKWNIVLPKQHDSYSYSGPAKIGPAGALAVALRLIPYYITVFYRLGGP